MKPIHVIGITLATSFGIIWCVQIWSAGRWNTALQDEGDGIFFDRRQQNQEAAAAVTEEVFKDTPNPVTNARGVSPPSSRNWLQNIIRRCVAGIKAVGHKSRPAPPGVYFTLTYLSVRTQSGITGLSAGTQVVCVKDEGPVLLVKAGNVEFEARRQYLTNDLDVADLAVRNDAEARQAVASYIAQQQQAIDQRDATRKSQPSSKH